MKKHIIALSPVGLCHWGSGSPPAPSTGALPGPDVPVRPLSPKHQAVIPTTAQLAAKVVFCVSGISLLHFLGLVYSLDQQKIGDQVDGVEEEAIRKWMAIVEGTLCFSQVKKKVKSPPDQPTIKWYIIENIYVLTWIWEHLLFSWYYASTTEELTDFKRPKDKVWTFVKTSLFGDSLSLAPCCLAWHCVATARYPWLVCRGLQLGRQPPPLGLPASPACPCWRQQPAFCRRTPVVARHWLEEERSRGLYGSISP